MFNGSTPVLVITDLDLICEVMIKKFDIFPNRASLPNFNPKYLRKNVSTLRDAEWRKVRNILTPTFTGLKLKKMVPLISGVGKHLCAKFEQTLKTTNQEFQLKPLYRACTMDIIMNIVFGINVDTQVTHQLFESTPLGNISYLIKPILNLKDSIVFAQTVEIPGMQFLKYHHSPGFGPDPN